MLLVGSGVGALLSVWAPQNRVSMKVDRGRALAALFGGMLAIALISGGSQYELPWGNIMAEGRQVFQLFPHNILYPGIILAVTVLSVNILGDGLRDALQTRLAHGRPRAAARRAPAPPAALRTSPVRRRSRS